MIKKEVWQIVEDSRQDKGVLHAFNATFLTLILKSEGDDSLSKFKHIPLCNFIYKIITKFTANIFKPILLTLVSPMQSGFVEGCQILDGVILVHEAIHSLKITKKMGMLLK